MSKLLKILALSSISLSLVACGTVEGFGKDLKNLGGQIEKSSK